MLTISSFNKEKKEEEVPAFKNHLVKSYNMPITVTVNGAEQFLSTSSLYVLTPG